MFWDSVAGIYDVFTHVINRKASLTMRDAVAAMLAPDDRVLECACGTGLLTGVMAERCQSLAATDFSPRMLARAERKCREYDNVTFQQGNILALDFPDESFDVVVAANVIHLLDEPHKALAELQRVCRRGGRIIIPTYINENGKGKKLAAARLLEKLGVDFKRTFTLVSYKAFFASNGYPDAAYTLAKGCIPCAVAVLTRA